jgi:hypothetical protein
VTYAPYDPSSKTPDEGGTTGRLTEFNPYASQSQPNAASRVSVVNIEAL